MLVFDGNTAVTRFGKGYGEGEILDHVCRHSRLLRVAQAYTQVDDRAGVFIEHVYYNQLRDIDLPDFGVRPVLVGQQASTGRMYGTYTDDAIRIAQSIMGSVGR